MVCVAVFFSPQSGSASAGRVHRSPKATALTSFMVRRGFGKQTLEKFDRIEVNFLQEGRL